MVAFIGAAVWACSSSTPTGYGDGNGNGSNSTTNNGNNSSNNGNGNNSNNYGSNGNNNGSSNGNNNNGSSNGNNNGSTSNSTGNTSPTTTSMASGSGMGCGMPAIACSATVTAGAVATSNCFYTGTKGEGSNFYFTDGMGSTACVDANALCSKGGTAAQGTPANYNIYGAGFGFQVNQTSNYGDAGAPMLSSGGLSWAVAGTPPSSFRIGISAFSGPCSGSAGCCYQTTAGATSGTIMWGQFVTDCWDGASADGGTFSTSDGLFEIKFQANAGSAATTYDYCVTSISY